MSVQGLIFRLFPNRWHDSMEDQSRTWMMRCPNCGEETSIWDLGGVRWKAKGEPRRAFRCPHCGRRSFTKVYRKK